LDKNNTKLIMSIESLFYEHLNNPYNNKSLDIYEHLPTLKEYSQKYNHITEMGTRWGSSTLAFLMGCPEKLVSYDIISTPEVENIINLCDSSKYNFQFLIGDTLEIEIEDTDILFIDTLHTYNQLKKELNKHCSKVRNHIILHDTVSFRWVDEEIYSHASEILKNSKKIKSGLFNAVKDFIFENPDWYIEKEYKNNNGLMILSKTTNLPKISAIVPTIWSDPDITINLLKSLQESKYISQIILIENKILDIDLNFSKLERHQQSENIFVNPAWNLGVSLSKNNKLLIINDDMHFDENLIKISLPYITPQNGMIGIKTYNDEIIDKKDIIKINTPTFKFKYFASLFFIHKESYIEIPEEMRIFCGDHYLYYFTLKQNYLLTGFKYKNEGSLSSNNKIFNDIILNDIKNWNNIRDHFFSKLILDIKIEGSGKLKTEYFELDKDEKIIYYNFSGFRYVLIKFESKGVVIFYDFIDCLFSDIYEFKNIIDLDEYNIKIYGY
jgi:hypothetical protein